MAKEEPIRLFLRLRPAAHPSKAIHWTNQGSTISGQLGTFSADFVYGNRSTNLDIFKTSVSPIVQKCCQGYNTALMAYGQSGSGKTHTILGDTNDEGLLPQIISHLFEEVERQQKISDRSFLVLLQMMELYCEKFVDLLSNDSGQKVTVMEETNGGTRVINLKEIPIKTKKQAFDLIKLAQERRVVGATEMNEQSSRSHVIVQLTVESSMTGKSNQKSRRSVMNIVDLAGSENAANSGLGGLRAKEGVNINLSLLTLTRVINILTDKNVPAYIPYRDSNLTRVLKPCLGGNSTTLIICCLDPQNREETLRTLKFSERLKLVKGQVQVNEEFEGGQLNEYLKEIASLKKALSEQQEAKEEQEAKTKRLLELKNFIIGANESKKHPTRIARRQTFCASSTNHSGLRRISFSPPSKVPKMGRIEMKPIDEEEVKQEIVFERTVDDVKERSDEEIALKEKEIEELKNELGIAHRTVEEFQFILSNKDGLIAGQEKVIIDLKKSLDEKLHEEEQHLQINCQKMEEVAEAKRLLARKDEVVAWKDSELEKLANEVSCLRMSLQQAEKKIEAKVEATEHFKKKAAECVRFKRDDGARILELEDELYRSNKEIEKLKTWNNLSEEIHSTERINLQRQLFEREEDIVKLHEINELNKTELAKIRTELDKKQKRIMELAAEKTLLIEEFDDERKKWNSEHERIEKKRSKRTEKELETLKEQIVGLYLSQQQRTTKIGDLRKELKEKTKEAEEINQKLLDLQTKYDKGLKKYNELCDDHDGLKKEARIIYEKYIRLKETKNTE